MDWTGLGLKDNVAAWLEAAAEARYARSRRLDPFATSMRDFDDASEHLKAIRSGHSPAMNDAPQRVTDLKSAGLVSADGAALTELGNAVLVAWEKYGVDTDVKTDELARLLLMALEASRLGDESFGEFMGYWSDLRAHFEPLDLIENWDSLYQINYLDYERKGFVPGATYRDEKVKVEDLEFDLADYAKDIGAGDAAVAGAEKLERSMEAQVPRGRHRATACMAYELILTEGQSASAILGKFGYPKRPRIWAPFSDTQKDRITGIIADYGIAKEQAKPAPLEKVDLLSGNEPDPEANKPSPVLPSNIDFSSALVEPPKPKSQSAGGGGKGGAPKKIDYKQKAHTNDAIGKLAEAYAVRYEQWRLRDLPDLLKKLKHVSQEDDSLGYDIESFELDGSPRFVEVKGTMGPLETRFFISENELNCAEQKGGDYLILRVGNLGSEPKCCEVRYPFDGKLVLKPANYSVVFSDDTSD